MTTKQKALAATAPPRLVDRFREFMKGTSNVYAGGPGPEYEDPLWMWLKEVEFKYAGEGEDYATEVKNHAFYPFWFIEHVLKGEGLINELGIEMNADPYDTAAGYTLSHRGDVIEEGEIAYDENRFAGDEEIDRFLTELRDHVHKLVLLEVLSS